MSTSKRKTYHHGDLRQALLTAADRLLDEGGTGAVSLREAARRAGVSAPAAYRHFADKESLLAALAAQGFDEFAAALGKPAAGRDSLAAMGQAYVAFAVERPGRFRLMFGPAVSDRDRYPDLKAAVERASIGFRGATKKPREMQHGIAMLRAWSMIHGLSQLIIDGMLPGHDARELALAVTTAAK